MPSIPPPQNFFFFLQHILPLVGIKEDVRFLSHDNIICSVIQMIIWFKQRQLTYFLWIWELIKVTFSFEICTATCHTGQWEETCLLLQESRAVLKRISNKIPGFLTELHSKLRVNLWFLDTIKPTSNKSRFLLQIKFSFIKILIQLIKSK